MRFQFCPLSISCYKEKNSFRFQRKNSASVFVFKCYLSLCSMFSCSILIILNVTVDETNKQIKANKICVSNGIEFNWTELDWTELNCSKVKWEIRIRIKVTSLIVSSVSIMRRSLLLFFFGRLLRLSLSGPRRLRWTLLAWFGRENQPKS